MCEVVPTNFDFGDQMAMTGWLQNQNELISPMSDNHEPIPYKQVPFEYKLPNDIQTN